MSTQLAEGTEMKKSHDETRIAEAIVSVLPAGVARELSAERDTLRYSVRGDGMKLRTISLRRSSLRRLAADPARDVKIDYLRRELLQAATQRSEYRYPRPLVQVRPATIRMIFPLASCH